MTVVKGLVVAGVIGLLALPGARACDDYADEMELAAAIEAHKAAQTAAAGTEQQSAARQDSTATATTSADAGSAQAQQAQATASLGR